jgi:dipeptide transport system permease protein
MIRFLVTRVGLLIPTFLGVTLCAFFFIRLIPGDPIETRAGERGVSPERHAQLMHQYGLDLPLHEQYLRFLGDLMQGDLGRSIATQRPILQEFATLFPATLELSFFAMLFAVTLGLPAGILAATRRGTFWDHSVMGAALTGYSMPIFWWGLLLIMVFSNPNMLGWTPVSGRLDYAFFLPAVTGFNTIDALLDNNWPAFVDALEHLILPAIVLGTIPLAVIARQTRSAMLEVLGDDYVRTARAKGLSPRRIVWVHALRNALIPVITVIGLQVGLLMAGAILTETIFSWNGVGQWIVNAIGKRDYVTVQAGLLLLASVVMVVNLLVDLLYGLINPRIRHAR